MLNSLSTPNIPRPTLWSRPGIQPFTWSGLEKPTWLTWSSSCSVDKPHRHSME